MTRPTNMMRRHNAIEIISKIQRFGSRILPESESRLRWSGSSCVRRFASTTNDNNNNNNDDDDDEPFYGRPLPSNRSSVMNRMSTTTIKDRLSLAVYHATTALSDPTRADAVAALAEVTGPVTLQKIHDRMMADETGRLILQERPLVSKATIPYDKLIAEAPDNINGNDGDDDDNLTFGQVYGAFLKGHGFDPDERDEVRFIQDETLAYIMLRYRQNHDFFHALTGLPPTVLGELGLKWLELFQTGLPIAALSCTVGSLRLSSEERRILQDLYLPWAMKHMASDDSSDSSSSCFLMNVYYEKEFDTPIKDLRKRLNLEAAPSF